MKRSLMSLILVFAIVLGFGAVSSYADILPLYSMQLTVQVSPLDVYPPIMIYTAQITPTPLPTGTAVRVEFYNAKQDGTTFELIGTAATDSTGKAVLNKQMLPGAYAAVSKAVVGGQNVTSNTVLYRVY